MIAAIYRRLYKGSPGLNWRAILWTVGFLTKEAIVAGMVMIEAAKMMGITPPVLTLNGRCVLCPP
jgi:hypothetical protein